MLAKPHLTFAFEPTGLRLSQVPGRRDISFKDKTISVDDMQVEVGIPIL